MGHYWILTGVNSFKPKVFISLDYTLCSPFILKGTCIKTEEYLSQQHSLTAKSKLQFN